MDLYLLCHWEEIERLLALGKISVACGCLTSFFLVKV